MLNRADMVGADIEKDTDIGIRMSEDLSAAMISRGYGITCHPTRLHDLHWTWRDTLLTLACVALPLLAVATG